MKDKELVFEISPYSKFLHIDFKEIWDYRDLILLFVRRDFVVAYKQTILGPLWYVLQPLLISVVFTLVFNNIANIKTGEIPPFLFNLTGITIWGYFKDVFTGVSDTFKKNENIFGKVYFPRLALPISVAISSLLKLAVQFLILVAFYVYFIIQGYDLLPKWSILFFPVLVIFMGIIGLGFGTIISSLVAKYRDLHFLVNFLVQIFMYLSLVMFPMSLFEEKGFEWIVRYNPMAYIIELGRYMFLGEGFVGTFGLIYTPLFAIFILFLGILLFNRTEKHFIDTI